MSAPDLDAIRARAEWLVRHWTELVREALGYGVPSTEETHG